MTNCFHLAIPAGNIKTALGFYRDILGCKTGNQEEGRWIDINFWGNELTLHETKTKQVRERHDVDMGDVCVPHFGVHLEEKDFEEVYLEKYKLNSEESDLKISCKNNFIFKKESLDKELKRGTSEKQIWINIEHQDWKSWLEDNYEHDDVFVWSSNHPNQKGITNWYDLVLSDKIKKIIH